MLNILRLPFMIFSVVAVGLLAAVQQPQWAQDIGLEPWEGSAWQRQLFPNNALADALYVQDRNIQKRIALKEQIMKDLTSGQITLFQAAARFRYVNQELPIGQMETVPTEMTPEEFLCRQVIRWTRNYLDVHPGAASEDLCQRLEKDLARHKQRHGTVVLPAIEGLSI